MKRIAIVTAALLTIPAIAYAVPSPKYFVCKYVGTPDVNETLQTGQNPISVSGNALTPPIVIGGSFNDAQGRSYVVAEDTGQDEPECPVPQGPPVDVCPNIQGNQATVPVGKVLTDGQCVDLPIDNPEEPKEEQPKDETPQTQGATTSVETPLTLPGTDVIKGK